MNLYKTTFRNDEPQPTDPRSPRWTASQSESATMRKTLKQAGMVDIKTVEVDVPTKKAELLAFLNGVGVA